MPEALTLHLHELGRVEEGAHAMRARPDLAMAIAAICADWSMLEQDLATLFTRIVEGRQGAALAVYETLKTSSAQRECLKAIADAVLPAERAQGLRPVLRAVEVAGTHRNRIAHGVWAAATTRPDSLLLWDGRERRRKTFSETAQMADLNAAKAMVLRGGMSHAEYDRVRDAFYAEAVPPVCFIEYRLPDFDEALSAISTAGRGVQEFDATLGPVGWPEPSF